MIHKTHYIRENNNSWCCSNSIDEYEPNSIIKELVVDLNLAQCLIESSSYPVKERIEFIFYYFPELKKLSHTKLAVLLGCYRETISRSMKLVREGGEKR